MKDRYDFRKGSKAERSFKAATFLKSRGVGTPQPIAYFDCWEGSRLVESFYLSDYVESLVSFKERADPGLPGKGGLSIFGGKV